MRTTPLRLARPGVDDRARGRAGERGAAAVEFALVVIPLMALLFGIIDFGWIFNQQVSLSNAARESARYYAVHEHDGGTVAQAVAWGKDAAPTVAAASWTAAGAGLTLVQGCNSAKPNYSAGVGKAVTVTATIPMPSLTGLFTAALGPTLSGKGKTACGG
ncbi:Flp pilus assembly protein TadG [Agromyces sp. CF514]|uniref:TadE/TadG family type IV pilus assembly protein n=1 Tax=Agromyces sp. CF514 TaxID=1881031 RepID=UPI0008EE356B|nr:TadE/TadG family type IV pilus assembly protein [Agromyces sp. CF514]SFR69124.1 Flp pilus assembly protein TadG [Agromyces sp. CF514]